MSEEAFVPRKLQIFFSKTILLSKSKIELSLLHSHSICIPLLFQSFFFLSHLWFAPPIQFLLDFSEVINFLQKIKCAASTWGKRVDSWPLMFLYFAINKDWFVLIWSFVVLKPFCSFSFIFFPCLCMCPFPYSYFPAPTLSCVLLKYLSHCFCFCPVL